MPTSAHSTPPVRLPRALIAALALLLAGCDPDNATRNSSNNNNVGRDGRLTARVAAPTQSAPVGLSVQKFSSTGRQFAVYVPSNYTPSRTWPMTVILHGYGDSGEAMALNFREYAESAGLVLIAPNSYGPTWDLILNQSFGVDRTYIDNMLKWVFDHIAVDATRLSVSGFSDGATYSLWLGLKNGDLFSRIAAFTPCATVPRTRTGMPSVFISHGIDDKVLPIEECSRLTVPSLEDAGYAVQFVEYPSDEGNGHFITPSVITEGMGFLARQ